MGSSPSTARSAAAFEREVAGLRARRDAAGIARGLAAHSSHAGVAAKGCEALFHLTQSEGAADHMLAIARHGGIEALLAARARHPDVAVVQQDALGALGNLANDADNKVAIARLGGIEAVLAARARHPDHALLQWYALVALNNLEADNAGNGANAKQIIAAGGEAAIKTMMQAPNATADTKKHGQVLLVRLEKVAAEKLAQVAVATPDPTPVNPKPEAPKLVRACM